MATIHHGGPMIPIPKVSFLQGSSSWSGVTLCPLVCLVDGASACVQGRACCTAPLLMLTAVIHVPWNLPEPTSWLGNLSTEESIHVAHRATSPSPRAWPGTAVPSLGASAGCLLLFQIEPSETSQQATLTFTLRAPKALRADTQFIPQTFEHSLSRCGES